MNAWIGLGSNIGDGPAEIARAIDALSRHPDLELLRRSATYRTAPWGVQDQPDFYNAVAEFRSRLEARALLRLLLDTEAGLGRQRDGRRRQPRRIDLDLLLLQDRIYFLPGLVVPHPRMHRRAFVLAPLSELQPDLVIPGRGTVRSCLEKLGPQRVERASNGGGAENRRPETAPNKAISGTKKSAEQACNHEN